MLTRRLTLTALIAVGMATAVHAQERAPEPPPPPPSFKGQTILVAGANGRTGKHIVAALLADGAKVKAISRNIDKLKQDVPGAQWIAADVKDPAILKGVAKGVDRVVFAIGSNSFKDPSNKPELVDFKGVAALAAEAKSAGVKQFVLISSTGVSKSKPDATTGIDGVMRYKLDGEKALIASGVPYTIIRPTGLWDKPGGQFGIVMLAQDVSVPAMITREDVATVAVQALASEKALNATFEIFNIVVPDVNSWKKDFPKLSDK